MVGDVQRCPGMAPLLPLLFLMPHYYRQCTTLRPIITAAVTPYTPLLPPLYLTPHYYRRCTTLRPIITVMIPHAPHGEMALQHNKWHLDIGHPRRSVVVRDYKRKARKRFAIFKIVKRL